MSLPHLQTIDTRPNLSDYLPTALPAIQTPVVTTGPLLPAMEPEPYLYRYDHRRSGYEPSTRYESPYSIYTVYANAPMRNRHEQKIPYISSRMSIDSASPVDVVNPGTDDHLAAEALCGLGQVAANRPQDGRPPQQPEPLLSLIGNRYPWIGGPGKGAMLAYNQLKSFSPGLVQNRLNNLETTVGTVGTTIGHIGRGTGVEGQVRRYLGDNSSHTQQNYNNDDSEGRPAKRRRTVDEPEPPLIEVDPAQTALVRDCPEASGLDRALTHTPATQNRQPTYADRSYATQTAISIGGLGVAFSDASLRSLRNCRMFLNGVQERIQDMVRVLADLIAALLEPARRATPINATNSRPHDPSHSNTPPLDDNQLIDRIKHLTDEIWGTLKDTVANVNKYTGGSILPERASVFVTSQLMSMPRRWQKTIPRQHPDTPQQETITYGQHMVAFGKEGLEVISNVYGVLDETIKGAENWLRTLGPIRS